MISKYRRWIVLILVLAVVGWIKLHPKDPPADANASQVAAATAKVPAVARRLGTLAFAPCSLAPEFGIQSIEAQCTTLLVPEDHAKPEGRKISLAIAWLPAKGEAEPDPMVMIAGGPGQSALETFPGIAPAFAEVNKKRNIILVDQRGTGGSNKLSCKNAAGKNAVLEDEDDLAGATAFAARCVAELSKKADLRFYSTTDAIEDLDDVRRAIGAEQLNLMGVSYGTRVAQQYGKKYPAHVRTITIDGIAPNSLVLGAEFARNLEDSLDLQFGRCKKDKACADKLGDTRARLNALMKTLATAPPTVNYRDAISGDAKQDLLTPGHVVTLTRMFAYSPQAAGLLPLEINEAAQGRYEPIMALSHLIAGTLGEQIMTGMQMSVICTEDASEMQVDTRDADSLLGQDLVTVMAAQCTVWPKGKRPDGFRAPLTGNSPVLILSGEFDPVTPPRYGEEVHKSLPNSRHLIVRGQGHNVLPIGCMPRLFARFVDTADAKSLDATCLDKVPYAQPFTGFYGWEP